MLWGCVVCMGPCLLVASCVHRHLPCASPQADRGVAAPWTARCESVLRHRRGRKRKRRKPKDDAPLGERYAWREKRRRQSSTRICMEHTHAEHKQWRPLQRYIAVNTIRRSIGRLPP
jgi:hypothetical protein